VLRRTRYLCHRLGLTIGGLVVSSSVMVTVAAAGFPTATGRMLRITLEAFVAFHVCIFRNKDTKRLTVSPTANLTMPAPSGVNQFVE